VAEPLQLYIPKDKTYEKTLFIPVLIFFGKLLLGYKRRLILPALLNSLFEIYGNGSNSLI